jgi:ATF/CREB family transcription factor
MDTKPPQPAPADQFTQHDAADAANGLFMLAKGGQANNMQANPNMQNDGRAAAARRVSSNTNGTSGREMSGDGSEQELSRPKGKGKKNAPKAAPAANNRRKADDAAKGPNKKAKPNSVEPPSDMDSDDEDMKKFSGDPKKMTDEEKRRNFLERNRYVAFILQCQRDYISTNIIPVSLP